MASGLRGFQEKGEFAFTPGSVLGLRWFWLPTRCLPPVLGPPGAQAEPVVLYGQTSYAYTAGINEAICGSSDGARNLAKNVGASHQVPASGCGCGFWAYWTIENASRHDNTSNIQLPVLGVVEGVGRVIHGELGFRAQKVRLVALHPAFEIQLAMAPGHENVEYNGVTWTRELLAETALAAQAGMEARLAEAFPDAPVYASQDAMLAMHKPGKGFLT